MTRATNDTVTFYSSLNLKDWTKESEFGENIGAHGGVWECPDLFTLDNNCKRHWVLIASANPLGPNQGFATQYLAILVADIFAVWHRNKRGSPDDYARITKSNIGKQTMFSDWMDNW